jgi:hypothetical protein
MGSGEDYMQAWVQWFSALPPAEREKYKAEWAEPKEWNGFYAFHETGTLPPQTLEQRQKVEAAGRPPLPNEEKITDRYHFLWMVRKYLKRIAGSVKLPPGAEWAELYEAPNGDKWIAIIPKGNGDPYVERYR